MKTSKNMSKNAYLDLLAESPVEQGGDGSDSEMRGEKDEGYLDPVAGADGDSTPADEPSCSDAVKPGPEEYIALKKRSESKKKSSRKKKPGAIYYNVNDPEAHDDTDESTLSRRDTVTKLPIARQHGRRRRGTHAYAGWDGHHQYRVGEIPPWYLIIFLAFQHYLIMFGATVSNPLTISKTMCIGKHDHDIETKLIGTIFVTSGLATFLQATLGVRLPLVQGGSFTFVVPIKALMQLPEWKCPSNETASLHVNISDSGASVTGNITTVESPFLVRMREVQGALMVASLFQVFIGFSGVMGVALRFIGPLSVAPTIALAGLALFDVAADYSSKQWWITLVTVVLIAAFSQYTRNLNIPCFTLARGKGCRHTPLPLFRLFPVILAMSITWIICGILTAAHVFPSDPKAWGHDAQTNLHLSVIEHANWFYVPYPGQWGMPTVSAAGVFGVLAGVLAGIVESVGDYYACARMAGAPPPPVHAVNRGIGMEGILCVLAGAFGTGSGTTTYSENIGAIGITKVGSRRVIQVAAMIMIVFGIFAKFGAFFTTIPDPIVGGVFIVMFGMVTAVGISNLQFVNLNSSRNLFIIGFSFFFGLTLPKYMSKSENAIHTGSDEVDQILTVLLSTSMFVGGLAGFVLDNTIPGTDEERGLIKWREQQIDSPSRELLPQTENSSSALNCYEIPRLTRILERWPWTKYVPFLPTFQGDCLHLLWRTEKTVRSDAEVSSAPGSPV